MAFFLSGMRALKTSNVWMAAAQAARTLGLGLLVGSLLACAPSDVPAPVVKIAFVDPLSGPFGEVGRNQLRSWQWVAERHNAQAPQGAPRFEVVGFDNRGSPQESVNAIKVVIDQGFRYVVQGNSSGVAHLIVETLNRYNARAPGREVLYLNYAAMDPALTNEQCSPWHFRVDADTSMKVEALALFLRERPEIKKIFLINQNYAHGQQVASFFKAALARHRPDVRIVGDELHPLGTVKSFDAHVGRIRASGAQAVVSGNWGPDLTGLVQSMQRVGLNVPLFTYYAAVSDTPSALAQGNNAEVYLIAANHSEHSGELGALMKAFQTDQGEDFYSLATHTGLRLLSHAMAQAQSTDPAKVWPVLKGLSWDGFDGPMHMRSDDHQLQTGLWLSRWQASPRAGDPGLSNTGHTFAPVAYLPGPLVSRPTTCVMQRP
jgi:branched-chain amino acid transport system substrate-binding protein